MAMISEGEEEVELSLGLSIGGSFKKFENPNLSHRKSISPARSCDIEVEFKDRFFSRFVGSPLAASRSNVAEEFLLRKKEIHARRRQEARRKRDEKQQQKRDEFCRKNGFISEDHVPAAGISDRAALEYLEFQSRVSDRAAKEIEACRTDRIFKKNHEGGDAGVEDQNVALIVSPNALHNSNPNPNPNPNPNQSASPSPFSVMPMQYPPRPVQYMPFANGFPFPYMMPCWTPPAILPASAQEGLCSDNNVFQPVAFRALQSGNSDQNRNRQMSGELNGDGGKDTTSGSQGSNFSQESNNQSASLQGESSIDTRSHLSDSPEEQSHAPSEHKPSTHLIESVPQPIDETTGEPTHQSSSPSKPVLQTSPLQTSPTERISSTSDPKSPTSPNHEGKEVDHEREGGKNPPKHQQECLPPRQPSLPQMPCVSTTGPNGKTITGFLYRYTKSEVSIVCVCHGSSFSPAEFVKHAGGVDVAHPLRHIVVVPSLG